MHTSLANSDTSSSSAFPLSDRLARHFAAGVAVATLAVAAPASAAIISTTGVNIAIPATTAGIYLNVVTGVSNAVPASAPGWDVNPFSQTALSLFSPTVPTGGAYVGPGTTYNQGTGTPIGSSSTYVSGTTNGTNWNLNSSNNLVGFRFQNEANGNAIQYGWFRIQIGATIGTRAITEYAYESTAGTGIAAGAVPEPATIGLFGLGGAIALFGLRRRS